MSDTIDGLAVRAITTGEYTAFADAVETAFGTHARPEDVARWREITELDRTHGIFDAGRIVATATADSLTVTVPGGSAVTMAGITAVGVLPTHRRRGLLRGLMRRLLDDAHARGEALAGLWASEAIIYGRFGFGCATWGQQLTIDTRHAAFAEPVDLRGRTRLLTLDEVAEECPTIYERARPATPGMLSRSPARWKWARHDPEHLREGASSMFSVAYEDRGYARYRIKQDSVAAGVPAFTLLVTELVAADDEALRGLWRFLLDIDLVSTVQAERRPVDDPLPLLLADPRRAQPGIADALWLRLLDVPAALAARRYAHPGSLVLEVADEFCPWVAGTYLLEVREDHARCAATGEAPELTLRAADLAAMYLGGASPRWLARAGRVTEHRSGALALAGDLFATSPAPWCPFVF